MSAKGCPKLLCFTKEYLSGKIYIYLLTIYTYLIWEPFVKTAYIKLFSSLQITEYKLHFREVICLIAHISSFTCIAVRHCAIMRPQHCPLSSDKIYKHIQLYMYCTVYCKIYNKGFELRFYSKYMLNLFSESRQSSMCAVYRLLLFPELRWAKMSGKIMGYNYWGGGGDSGKNRRGKYWDCAKKRRLCLGPLGVITLW